MMAFAVVFFAAFLAVGVLQMILRDAQDAQLVRRLKARESRAMSELYDRFGRMVYSVVFRIVRNAATSEDLTQETFLRVWNRVQSFDEERGALGSWVLTVARNRAIDHLRSVDGRLQSGAIGIEKLENTQLFASLETDAISLEQARRLKQAVEQLNPQQRQVIDLAYYEGLSQSEMAERLKQPLGTIKTWTRSALKILREQMAQVAMA